MTSLQDQLCDELGVVFEMASDAGFDSELFIRAFMTGKTAERLDNKWHQINYCGELHTFENFERDNPGFPEGVAWKRDIMHWIGYIYRCWHFMTGEASREIVEIAPPTVMADNYHYLHTLDPEWAVERLLADAGRPLPVDTPVAG